jgi:hypothetical protein
MRRESNFVYPCVEASKYTALVLLESIMVFLRVDVISSILQLRKD